MVTNSALSFTFTPASTEEHYSTASIFIDKNLTKKVSSFSIAAEQLYRIGVILPLSGSSSKIGNDVLQGIQFALQHRREKGNSSLHIELSTFDTKQEPLTASLRVRELANDSSVRGIIGPLFSEEVHFEQ